MAVIAAIFKVCRHAHLRDATGRVSGEGLQPLNFLLKLTGYHPAYSHTRRQGFREA